MKTYFIQLLNYDKHANLLLLDGLFEAQQPARAVKIMAHMLVAQQIWLHRCKDLPAPGGPLWPDWDAIQFKYIIEKNHQAWVEYVSSLNDDEFNTTISYVNFKGDHWQDKLVNILTHLVNHGTHHRAQVGNELKLAGLEKLPVTDYIFYVRGLKQ